MLKEEFKALTGMNPSEEEYKDIEDMYVDCGDMDKDEFCKDFAKHGSSTILSTYYRQYQTERERRIEFESERYDLALFLLRRAQAMGDQELLNKAYDMIGHSAVIRAKLASGLPLWKSDMEYIEENI